MKPPLPDIGGEGTTIPAEGQEEWIPDQVRDDDGLWDRPQRGIQAVPTNHNVVAAITDIAQFGPTDDDL